jgi:FKBP-type peptidyl-prolyl cis-trans isomerase SlyD
VSGEFQVGPETFVTLSVSVRDAEGELLIEPEVSAFVFGMGQMNPVLERGLDGRRVSESFEVALAPDQAFGVRQAERILTVARDEFPPDLAEGDTFELEDLEGNLIVAHVLGIEADAVVLDTNHPLADQTVTFQVTVLEVRPATEREIRSAEAEIAELEQGPPDVLLGSLIRRAVKG